MRAWLLMFTLFLSPGLLWAQEAVPEVDQAEVLRRGDLVQVVGDGVRSHDHDVFATAMGPPASDADKWFISVVSMQGCAGCEKLKKDWTTSPWLLALANPNDAKLKERWETAEQKWTEQKAEWERRGREVNAAREQVGPKGE